MPTYFCHVPKDYISDNNKKILAHAITNRHTEATGAPSWFVQVIIEEERSNSRFLGGIPSSNHIWVRADIRAGRSKAQLQELMLNIKADISGITGINTSDIWIYLNNIEAENMLEYGYILPPPGGEALWFNELPEYLQERLKSLGITHTNFRL